MCTIPEGDLAVVLCCAGLRVYVWRQLGCAVIAGNTGFQRLLDDADEFLIAQLPHVVEQFAETFSIQVYMLPKLFSCHARGMLPTVSARIPADSGKYRSARPWVSRLRIEAKNMTKTSASCWGVLPTNNCRNVRI